jgi:putative membrane protein
MANWMKCLSGMGMLVLSAVLATGTATARAQAGGMGNAPQQSQQMPGAGPGGVNQPAASGALTGPPMNQASMQDKEFLREAAQGGMFEIEAGELAQQKGASDDVKQFGQMMVTDHTELNNKMTPVLQDAGVTAPKNISGKDKKELAKLQSLSGSAFDQEYIATMLKDHKKDKEAFEIEARNGQLPVEKTAAKQAELVIEKHLTAITQIAQAHNASAGI